MCHSPGLIVNSSHVLNGGRVVKWQCMGIEDDSK